MENLVKISELKLELDSLRPLKKEDELRIMQKFRLDWNYHSNHLEGNSLTYGETKALVLFGITAQGKPLKDHFEMTGHDEAIKWIIDIVKQDRPLTENFIRELHTLILKEPYEVDAITPDGKPTKKTVKVGQYKTTPNHVETPTGEIFRFATPEETPAKMKELVDWFREEIEKPELNPILVASKFHYDFIRIHPFDDGNGRTARILMNFILMQNNYPPVIIKTEDRENYFSVLRQADVGIFEPFVEYISKNLIRSLEIMISGAKGQSIEEPDDLDKEISLLGQRLNSFSKPIKESKNKKNIYTIFEGSIFNLVEKFVTKAKLFEKYYLRHNFSFSLDASGVSKIDKVLDLVTKQINDNTSTMTVYYSYNALRQFGLENFYHGSEIKIEFALSKYIVKNSLGELVYEKLYTEQLTKKEIDDIIKSEIRLHKNKIETEIDKLE